MPGDQTPNFAAMTPQEFLAWQAEQAHTTGERFTVPAGADLTSATPSQITLGSAFVARRDAPAPNPNAWAEAKKSEEDFTCPSGQTCRLRRLSPEKLIEAGLLDKVSRLEGLAEDLVDAAEGAPPKPEKMPSREEIATLIEVLNTLLPIAVVEPKVYADDDKDAPEGAIRVSDIDLDDRMAIMDKSLERLKKLDRFRNA